MIYLFFLLVSFSYVFSDCSLPIGSIPAYNIAYYTQYVDHYNPYTNPSTYQQRYLYWFDCWVKETHSPIFFYAGNEDDITSFWNNTGFIFELAYVFKGAVIFAEHRFYGNSMPFGNQSLTPPYIGLLSAEQALSDYALMIPDLKALYGCANCPVFTVGGSYGGMLSAWFRMKYPDVVDGALAASAPIFIVDNVPLSPSFYETTTQDYAKSNPLCPQMVKTAFTLLLNLSSTQQGLDRIKTSMRLCKTLQKTDIDYLVLWVTTAFANLAMSDYPYPTDFGVNLPGYPINLSCELLVKNYPVDPLYALAMAAGVYYNGTDGNIPCFDIYDEFIFCSDQSGCGTGPSSQAWDYQACTELIFIDYTNTNGKTDMFPARNFTFQNLLDYCKKTWSVTSRQNWGQTEYGPNLWKYASNIIFSNGLLDPWHGGGVLVNISQSLPSILITEGAHHLDLRASNPQDPESVIWARGTEADYLMIWWSEKLEKSGEEFNEMNSLRIDSAPWPWVKKFQQFLEKVEK